MRGGWGSKKSHNHLPTLTQDWLGRTLLSSTTLPAIPHPASLPRTLLLPASLTQAPALPRRVHRQLQQVDVARVLPPELRRTAPRRHLLLPAGQAGSWLRQEQVCG